MTKTPTRLGDLLVRVRRPVRVDLTRRYEEVGIRSFGKGFFAKAPVDGATLGAKRIFEIQEGDLVLNIVFAWEGAVALARSPQHGKVASHRFPTYVADRTRADPRYIRYLLVSREGRANLEQMSPGSAGRNRTLNMSKFEELEVTLPTLTEQRRIADQLDDVQAQVSRAERLSERRANLARGLTNSWFAVLSRTSPSVALGQVLTQVRDDVTVEPTGTYRPAGIKSFGKGLFARPPISGADTKYKKFTPLREGRFVYSKVGSWEGAVAVVPADLADYVVSSEYPVFDLDEGQIAKEYLAWLCTWRGLRDLLVPRGSMVRRKRVHPERLLEVRVPLPLMDEQRRLGAVGAALAQAERKAAEMDRLLDALVPSSIGAALSGEL